MATDKIRKYVLPNIPYLFIGWFCLKIGTAYRLAAGAGFGEKLLGLMSVKLGLPMRVVISGSDEELAEQYLGKYEFE